jgi:hypothetical protein
VNKTQRFAALLERGYFPDEPPPPFNTRDFAKHREIIRKKWSDLKSHYPKSSAEIFSNPHIKRIRRNLSIVNPIAQLNISAIIADNWTVIQRYLRKSKYSIELISIVENKERVVPPPDFPLVALRRAEISSMYAHALFADISRFYGTLYTHAIPWALHGKAWSKKNLNKKEVTKYHWVPNWTERSGRGKTIKLIFNSGGHFSLCKSLISFV